jgi:hypothetical protein
MSWKSEECIWVGVFYELYLYCVLWTVFVLCGNIDLTCEPCI